MASERMRKVNEEIRTQVSRIIAQEAELPLGAFVTVTQVDTSRDLKHSKVYVTILPDTLRGSTLSALHRSVASVQKMLGKHITMKFTPKLQFVLDEGQVKAQGIFHAIDAIDGIE